MSDKDQKRKVDLQEDLRKKIKLDSENQNKQDNNQQSTTLQGQLQEKVEVFENQEEDMTFINPLKFQVIAQQFRARATNIILPHGPVYTPVYMPVGTKGSIKGLTSEQMENLGCQILLGNTYHLAYKPGSEYLAQVGGLHKFMNWKKNILTDSGGFQMVSLAKLITVSEEGVEFQNPYDPSVQIFIGPEQSIGIQNNIGSDIMMALDDVVKTTTEGARMSEACDRTIRWIERNDKANKHKNRQTLFPIMQGGIDKSLREHCINSVDLSKYSGVAIGGLAGGEQKTSFWETVSNSAKLLPENKPRYLMGVGYPEDLVVCVCLGIDMFDCVFSTRTARFGTAFTKRGFLKIRGEHKFDFDPIDQDCQCECCTHYSKSYLSQIISNQETACHLLSIHNIHFLFELMRKMRQSIIDQQLPEFVNEFLKNYYFNDKKVPEWIQDAMKEADIKINENLFQQ